MRTIAALVMVLSVLLVPRPALAHGDDRLVDATLELGAGEFVEFAGEIHYHRLVGRFVATGLIDVRMVGSAAAESAISPGRAADVSVNQLVACCDGRVWTPHRLVISNPGDGPVTVDARATLVHDDLAVMVYRAEAGTGESVVLMGGLWTWLLWRIRRRRLTGTARRAVITLAGLVVATLVITLYGAGRYGTGSAPALVAGLADLPVLPFNPLVSRASLLMGVGMVGWVLAGVRWAKASGAMAYSSWVALGLVVAGTVIVTAGAIGTTYHVAGMPLAFTAVAVLPMLALTALERRGRHAGS